MTEEIVKYDAGELTAFNGRKAKATDDEIVMALSPIPVAFPHLDCNDEWMRLHKMMLRDIDPNVLARAVLQALAICTFPPTIADIRKAAGVDEKLPGEHEKVDISKMPHVGSKMYRPSPEEDARQRRAQLKRTKGWNYA